MQLLYYAYLVFCFLAFTAIELWAISLGITVYVIQWWFFNIVKFLRHPLETLFGPKPISFASLPHHDNDAESASEYSVCVIGAGFAGIGSCIKLREAGLTGASDIIVFERGNGVGGTWRDNVYPAAACDVPAPLYSFSFNLNPEWDYYFARQPEILRYLESCVTKYHLEPFIHVQHEVTSCEWIEEKQMWKLVVKDIRNITCDDDLRVVYARFVLNGQGVLAEPHLPNVPGLSSFKGKSFHSARWDKSYDLRGKRVAVIGSGSSVSQFLPEIQPLVQTLIHFQRSPPWCIPLPDFKVPTWLKWVYRHVPLAFRLIRAATYWRLENIASSLLYRSRIHNALLYPIVRGYLYFSIPDPVLRAKLTPKFDFGCKRVLGVSNYYSALQKPNVQIVFSELKSMKPNAVVAADGSEHEVDAVIFATGFVVQLAEKHNSTFPIRGRRGITMAQVCQDVDQLLQRSYLGVSVRDFPNMFFAVSGPNSYLGHNSIVFMLECQLNYIVEALRWMHKHGHSVLDVRQAVASKFNANAQKTLKGAVWQQGGCRSWYLDKDGNNVTLFAGYTWEYFLLTNTFNPRDYEVQA